MAANEPLKPKRAMLNIQLDIESSKSLDRAKAYGVSVSKFVRAAIKRHAEKIKEDGKS